MIEAKNLSKYFGRNKVVDSVAFTVKKGEILGFLGPNAAGKSTTMRMLTGYLPASSGHALIGGFDVAERGLDARRLLGYLPENAPVYQDMTVTGFLDFVARIRGFSGAEKAKALERTVERCFLQDVRQQAVGTLSKGFKQRVCFAQAILHDPPYLVLDEPTDGLDPNQKYEVRTMIREMGGEKAIILSTHILEEVDAVCTRAIVINKGKVVADDTPAGLRAKSSLNGAVTVAAEASADQLAKSLKGISGVSRVEVLDADGGKARVRAYPMPDADGFMDRVVRELSAQSFPVLGVNRETGRLDEVFRKITQSR
ncbi:MAG: ATP-binding cassette domain-containing protein [Thermodesulfobacteriota bacterium]